MGNVVPELLRSSDPSVAFRANRLLAFGDLVLPRTGAGRRATLGLDPMLIGWPIRFYDVLFALTAMTEADQVGDPRCADAVEVLLSKELSGGGFPAEIRTATRAERVVSGGTFANRGPAGATRPNPFITINANWVLGRTSHGPLGGA